MFIRTRFLRVMMGPARLGMLKSCAGSHARGYRVLFATPHAHVDWDLIPLTVERERLFEEAFQMASGAVSASGLDLRRGFELFATVLRECSDFAAVAAPHKPAAAHSCTAL